MVASYSNTGELIRLLYPNVDYKQFIDFFHVGIRLNDSGLANANGRLIMVFFIYYANYIKIY